MHSFVLTAVVVLVALALATTTLFYRNQVSLLRSQLASSSHQRVRRDAMLGVPQDENYFPLYTRLSDKSIHRICSRKWRVNKNQTKMKRLPVRKSKHTHCASIHSISTAAVWNRPFRVGSASKCREAWLVSEFASGYFLFEYQTKSHPSSVYTLPEVFEGTDHTAFCDSTNKYFIYFSSNVGWDSGSIIKFDLKTQKHIRTVLIASEKSLYNGSSSVDLEVDENWLWALYRLPKEQKLAVTKLALSTLKQADGWILDDPRLDSATNAFISCSILYSVNFDPASKMQRVEAVYNFETKTYLSTDQRLEWKASGMTIQNLHHENDSLNVFENGSIYTIKLYRT